jgi:hypothetical protein
MIRTAGRVGRYLWAGPWTLIAVVLAPAVLMSGGRVRAQRGVLELSGGLLRPLLGRMLPRRGIVAMTLGHAVIAVDDAELRRTRAHERVHVSQYETWGPFFPLMYAGASLAAWLRGRDGYLDNRFEREARRLAPDPPSTA